MEDEKNKRTEKSESKEGICQECLKSVEKRGKSRKEVSVGGKKIQIKEKWEKKEVLLIKVDSSPGFVMKLPGTMKVRENRKKLGNIGTY